MKKLLAILLAAILCVGLMAGCGQTTIIVNMGGEDEAEETPVATETPENTPEAAASEAPVVDDTPLPEGQLKTGLAIVSVVSSSSKAASAEAWPRPTRPSFLCSLTATASSKTALSTVCRPR